MMLLATEIMLYIFSVDCLLLFDMTLGTFVWILTASSKHIMEVNFFTWLLTEKFTFLQNSPFSLTVELHLTDKRSPFVR